MKCVVCRNGSTRDGVVEISLRRGETTLTLQQVPASVCDNCGEYYLSGEVAAKVLEMAESAVQSGADVKSLRFIG